MLQVGELSEDKGTQVAGPDTPFPPAEPRTTQRHLTLSPGAGLLSCILDLTPPQGNRSGVSDFSDH